MLHNSEDSEAEDSAAPHPAAPVAFPPGKYGGPPVTYTIDAILGLNNHHSGDNLLTKNERRQELDVFIATGQRSDSSSCPDASSAHHPGRHLNILLHRLDLSTNVIIW